MTDVPRGVAEHALIRAARDYCAALERSQAHEEARERAQVLGVALLRLHVAALETAEEPGAVRLSHELAPVARPTGFAPLAPRDTYRATMHATYDDEYGREGAVSERSISEELLDVYVAVARYLRALDDGSLDAGLAARSMRFGFDASEGWGARLAVVSRALEELRRW